MASNRTRDPKVKMIHCEYCGEDYAATYKRCPFCDELEPEESDEQVSRSRSRGGKRLVTNTRGGGYGGGTSVFKLIGTVVSLALIIAAAIIVISLIKPLVDRGNTDLPNSTPLPSQTVVPTPDSSETPVPKDTTPPVSTDAPTPDDTPAPTAPVSQTATGLTLSKSEFSFSDRYPDPVVLTATLIPASSTDTVTWTSSDPDVVQVDASGKVSPGSKRGTATITAALPDGVSQTCLVYNQLTTASSGTSSGSSALTLNRSDFTLDRGQSFQMRVSGTSSTPTWSIGNTSVAKVSGDGKVSYVGSGHTTLTCTVDGQTLTCIVRCN